MKKLFLSALLVLACLSACQKNEMSAPVAKGEVLYATIEDVASTRTVKDENNNIRWSEGDQIIAFMNSTLGVKYQVLPSSVGETSASFEEVSAGGLNAGTELEHIVAYYPYSSSVKIARSSDNYTLNAVLPSEQIYAPESFGNGTFPMIAVSSTNNLTFKNVCGAMKLQLKGTQKVASIKVEGKNNERLSGAASITAYADGNKPAITMSSDASTSVVLNCGSGIQLNETEATEFIITLPPTLFTKGFVVTISDAAGNRSLIETDKSNEVKRSSVLVMPAVTLENGDIIPQEGDYVDEYGINHGQGVEIDGVVWAPVNCGYHATDFKYGKLYQWGRKYGQGYNGGLYDVNGNYLGEVSDALVTEIVAGAVSLEIGQSKTNENKFYYNSSVPLDWCSPQNDNLWNAGTEANPVKTEYDPCPDGWRIPTYAELERLRQSSLGWTNQNGQNGYVFREANPDIFEHSNLFFSAAGYRGYQYNLAIDRGSGCYYWSSESDDGTSSFMTFYGTGHATTSRSGGFSIRCVQDDNKLIPVSTIALDESVLSLKVNDKYTLSATISPTNANHQYAFWWSADPSVATVDQDGNVSAVSFGNTIISAMAGMEVATCKVIVTVSSSESDLKDYVDEYGENHGPGIKIGETVWAPVNCGYHATDFKYGKLYQWGRKYGQGYSGSLLDVNGTKIGEYSDASVPSVVDGTISLLDGQSEINKEIFYRNLSGSYDWQSDHSDKLWNLGTEENPIKTEYDPCPEGWRVPTYTEYIELSQGESYWTEEDNITGRWYSQQNPSAVPSTFKVFLPAAGYRSYDYNAYARGSSGDYWTSTPNLETAFRFHFDMYYKSGMHSYRNTYAYAIRCVQDDDDLIKVERVIINQTQLTLSIDDSESLTATIIPSDANHSYAFWYSDNPEVAVVDQNGNVTAMAEGTTTITAVAGMQSVNCLVTVYIESEKKQYVDLSNNGTANCYIVSDSGAYQFAPTKGNSSESVGAIASAETLWETFGTDITPNVGDLVKNVKYADGAISFETPSPFKEGNAVIAAKDASGNILWSWHIWLTDEPQGQVYYNNAGTMMDRNLGATAASPGDVGALGLLYQWGRKDPFLGSSNISSPTLAKSTISWPSAVSSDPSTGTIGYAVSHPTTFITSRSSNCNWHYAGDSLSPPLSWTTAEASKSIYDPCPTGWRVPDGDKSGAWTKALGSSSFFIDSSLYNSTNKGMNFSGKFGDDSTIWYPASGARGYADGGLYNVGYDGNYWSASPYSYESYSLCFYFEGSVRTAFYEYRANGHSVRCVQE